MLVNVQILRCLIPVVASTGTGEPVRLPALTWHTISASLSTARSELVTAGDAVKSACGNRDQVTYTDPPDWLPPRDVHSGVEDVVRLALRIR